MFIGSQGESQCYREEDNFSTEDMTHYFCKMEHRMGMKVSIINLENWNNLASENIKINIAKKKLNGGKCAKAMPTRGNVYTYNSYIIKIKVVK
jgi:hypothetical protein